MIYEINTALRCATTKKIRIMKSLVLVLLFPFCIQHTSGQSSDISGFCDVLTTTTNQNVGIDWDDCEGMTYEGLVEIQSVDGRLYNVYTTDSNGDQFNDLSFGAYYGCYDATDPWDFPNSDANSPTLFLGLNADGTLYFSGRSKWNEVYFLEDVTMEGPELNFSWTNDFGEGAIVQLTRQDGQNWEDMIVPCPFVNEADSLALVALYNATDGPNWKIKWFLEDPVLSWYGVTIDPLSCRVSGIDLGPGSNTSYDCFEDCGNNLVGQIPEEITDMNRLAILDLRGNYLTGDLPDEIGNLSNLNFLDLSLNNITGIIPQGFGNLNNLTYVDLVLNDLTGIIPEEIGNFIHLERLNLGGNNLTGTIPNQLGNLSNLKFLSLEHNNLTGEIPPSLSLLNLLSHLYLSYNQLSGTIPPGFTNIRRVRFNNNMFSGHFPDSFSASFKIWEINLANNNFTGPIPSKYYDDFLPQRLYFGNNDFSGCIGDIGNLCTQPFDAEIDSLFFDEFDSSFYNGYGYNFLGNPKLAWEGDLQNACNGEDQIGAPCDDGDPNTSDTGIDGNCNCMPLVSTKDIKELNAMTISPNPISSGEMMNITLDLSNTINATVKLLDLNGRTITSKSLGLISGTKTYSLSIDNLTSGLYFVQVASENGIAIQKIAVQ